MEMGVFDGTIQVQTKNLPEEWRKNRSAGLGDAMADVVSAESDG